MTKKSNVEREGIHAVGILKGRKKGVTKVLSTIAVCICSEVSQNAMGLLSYTVCDPRCYFYLEALVVVCFLSLLVFMFFVCSVGLFVCFFTFCSIFFIVFSVCLFVWLCSFCLLIHSFCTFVYSLLVCVRFFSVFLSPSIYPCLLLSMYANMNACI